MLFIYKYKKKPPGLISEERLGNFFEKSKQIMIQFTIKNRTFPI